MITALGKETPLWLGGDDIDLTQILALPGDLQWNEH